MTGASQSPQRFVPALAAEWDLDAPAQRVQAIDASLLFADISGFTSLSERLATHGRIGAEELTEVLSRVFGSMISLGHERGGSLLKFGGDALLFLFRGPDHPVQACSAAVEMRSALRESARIPTSCGRVPLRMSVGVHSGPIQLFLVGGSHRELIVAGPGASTTIRMEAIAQAGEIVISREARARLGGDTPHLEGDGFVLPWRRARTPPTGPRPRRKMATGVLTEYLPTILRHHLLDGDLEPEHRMAVVAFVKFLGTDDLCATEGPDALAAALHQLVSVVQDAAADERVTFMASDVDANGGKIILATGLPVSGEDDELRMLRAVQQVVGAPLTLPVKAGINRGHVFVGEIGAPFRSAFTLMGDTVNVAARLMAAAPAGGVYAMPVVLDRSATLFSARPLEPFAVKGKSELIQAYEVGDEIGRRQTAVADELPLRGRDDELALLRDAVRAAEAGVGTVVDVVGDAGIGKSRLVADALAGATLPTLIFRGELDARANPYRAVRDAARALLGLRAGLETPLTVQLTDAVGRLAPHLSPLIPLVARLCHLNVPGTPESDAIDPQFVADRAADVMIELTRQLVPGPGVVVVEDAQWMDDASAHLLQRISGSARDYGWMMVVTRRPQGEGGFRPTGALEIELEPLDEVPATDLVIDATAATPLRPIDIAALVDRAAGNPLFLVALVSSLHDGGGTDLPDSLDAVMAAQIDSLAAVPRTVLRYASVLGTSASTKVLRTLLQDAGISLDDAARWDLRELLVADGPRRLRFKTVVLRDAAYASLSFRRRRQLHSRAATILAASARPDEVADRLALHHLRAQEYDQAWHFARIAGDRAQEAAANMAAALQYDHALEAAARLPHLATADLIDVWARLGDVLVAAGVFDGGLHAYTRAAQLARGEAQRTAELLMKRARAQERAGRFTAALRTTARIARLAEASGDAGGLAARALSFRCVIRCAQERPADTLRLARQAVVAARTCGDKESLAQALTMVDWAQRMLGVATTTANAEAALALYEELGDLNGQAMVHGNLGGERYFTGDWEAALEHYRRAEEACRKTGDTVQAAMADASIGEILVSQGRFDEALPLLIASARTMRASGFIDGAAFAEINIARLHLGRQQVAEAVEVLERVIAEVDALGLAASALEASMYRAECDVRLGQPAQALRRLTESKLRAGRRAEVFQAGLARVDALGLAGLGQTGLALDRLDQGIEIARAQGLVFELAQLLSERTRLAADRDPTQQAEALELLTRLRAEPPAHLLAI